MTNGRLLWVDDEIELLRGHIVFLEKKGYDVQTCVSGADAIETCRQNKFDLILLDENMPGLSGLETLSAIKDITPSVPVVMVTKNEAEDLMDQAIGSQIADYLLKPVNPHQILLTLKKNIHVETIRSETAGSAYRREFMQIDSLISQTLDIEGWMSLYKKLVRWEFELSDAPEAMNEMLRSQWHDAEKVFAAFVARHYEGWVAASPGERPLLSPDVISRRVFPSLRAGRQVVLMVFDNLRFDQWRVLSEELSGEFDIDESLGLSILPTATGYARNAIFAGLMPAMIKKMYPHYWVEEEDEEGKNLHEEDLLREQLARYRRREAFTYRKINDSQGAERLLGEFHAFTATPLSVLVVNFIDILSHARTDSRMVRELFNDEAAYRSITRSWFRHTAIRELFQRLATLDRDIIITTDHGSVRATTPVKVVGDRHVNTNLRYKLGKNLSYNPREVFEARRPDLIGLPAPSLSSAYIFATGDSFFAYPNNYNHYVSYYRDTFQHGGISMQEMLVPVCTLRSKSHTRES